MWRTRTAALVAVMLATPIAAEAQSCMGQSLQRGEKQLSYAYDNPAAVSGGTLGWRTRKDGEETLIHAWIVPSPLEGESATIGLRWGIGGSLENAEKTAAREARPASAKGKMPCGYVGMTGTGNDEYSTTILQMGLGYAFGNDAASFYVMPQAGFGSDGIGFLLDGIAGATYRSGAFFASADLVMPLNTAGATTGLRIRGGFVFGKAVPYAPPKPPEPVVAPTIAGVASSAAAATQPPVAATQPSAAGGTQPPTTAATQPTAGTKPYSADDVAGMLANNVPTARILQLAARSCIGFRMNDAIETRLRRAAADPELIEGLRKTCYAAP